MKSIFSRFALAVAVAISVAAFAQDGAAAAKPNNDPAPSANAPAPTKVGIIDIQGAIQASNEGQRDIEALNKKFEPKQQELAKLNSDVQALQKQLNDQGSKMNDDARSALAKQIEQKQRQLQQGAESAQADYQSEGQDLQNRIGQKMMKTLDKYAKENGYIVILNVSDQSTPVLWANPQAADVTPKIIELYNKESGVAPPAAPPATRPGAPGTGATTTPRPTAPATRPPATGTTGAAPKKP